MGNSGIQNPESCMGCYAMNPTDYDKFYNFFKPALEKYHKVNLSEKKHVNDWNLKGVEGLPADGKLDVSAFGLGALSMRIRTARNLNKFPLPGAMTEEDRKNMELAMKPVFDELIKNPDFGGEYVSLTPGHPNHISDERYQQLVKEHIMFKHMADDSYLVTAGIAGDWPAGRGCFISADKGFIIWVGEEDHLRIMAMKKIYHDQRRLRSIESCYRCCRKIDPRWRRQISRFRCYHLLPHQHGYWYASFRPRSIA